MLDDGAVAVDATMKCMTQLLQDAKKVYAFDARTSTKSTQERLEKQAISNAQLILDGHQI